uniref:Putative synaptotagmin-5-like n=1 Tax=Davidia involucrata TaxID=16924 RepID=A0A5B6ZBU4_DAVIN
MGFFLGLVFGIALGIGLIIGLAHSENIRSKRRSDLAKAIAAFARMTVQDSRKILPAANYPSWVVFSQRQKLTWLNAQLDKIWPYVNEAASELIRTSVEPILEQYKPAILSSLKFSKLTLGTVAPQFTGVSIIEGDAGGVTMELEMQWDGNPNIVLDIKTKVGVGLPIQVKNIGFTGVFRLIFKPLVDEFPCFGAICYSLREKKKLDFTLKVVGGEISAIPGISDAIEETIRDAIEDSITWPVRNIIPILPGDYSDLELKPVGTLEVKLIQAKELTNKDIIGKSDPYAVLFIRPLRDKMKTSKTINNQLNPIWNEHFEFIVEDVSTQHLTIRVFDDEGVQASELIGCAQVPLKDLEPSKVKDVWLKLVKDLEIQRDNKYRGQVHLELLYCPFGTESVFTNPFDPDSTLTSLEKALKPGTDGSEAANIAKFATQKRRDVIVRGVLSVTVISAEDLPAVDLMGKSDPYVVLIMKKSEQKNKTRVVNDSLNPVWNQTFDFVVEDGLHDLLILEAWDHDTFGKDKMGKCIMTLTRVILEGEFTDTFPLDGTKSGKLHLHLKWNPQPIFRDV